jgi:hypothetical protein
MPGCRSGNCGCCRFEPFMFSVRYKKADVQTGSDDGCPRRGSPSSAPSTATVSNTQKHSPKSRANDLVCFFSGWPFEAFLFFSDLPQLALSLAGWRSHSGGLGSISHPIGNALRLTKRLNWNVSVCDCAPLRHVGAGEDNSDGSRHFGHRRDWRLRSSEQQSCW